MKWIMLITSSNIFWGTSIFGRNFNIEIKLVFFKTIACEKHASRKKYK